MRDDPGLHWLRGWTAAWFVVIALLATCCGHRPSRSQAVEPAPRTITVTLRCLAQEPPAPMPAGATDAQLAQAYEVLRRWVWLYAMPTCRE